MYEIYMKYDVLCVLFGSFVYIYIYFGGVERAFNDDECVSRMYNKCTQYTQKATEKIVCLNQQRQRRREKPGEIVW